MFEVYEVTGDSNYGQGIMVIGASSVKEALLIAQAKAFDGVRVECDIVDYDECKKVQGVYSNRKGVLVRKEWAE